MQVSSLSSQVVIQKYGFLIMAPIALMMHGALLLVPMSQQQQAKEPEKKEELQPIAAIAQLPPIATSASPMPKPVASKAPIVQAQQQSFVPAPIVQQQPTSQTQPTPKQPTSQASQPTTPPPPQTQQATPPVVPVVTSSSIIGAEAGTTPCPGSKNCYRIVSQQVVRKSLEKAFGTTAEDIKWGDDNYSIGFKIANKEGKMEYFYFVNALQLQKVSEELTTRELLAEIGVNVM